MVTHNGSQKETTPTEKEDDTLQWMEASSQGRPYDPIMVQIDLSLISMHSKADILTQILYVCHKETVSALSKL